MKMMSARKRFSRLLRTAHSTSHPHLQCRYATTNFNLLFKLVLEAKTDLIVLKFDDAIFQICRVEDVHINGTVLGSAVHLQRVKTISIRGLLSASSLGMSLQELRMIFSLSCLTVALKL